MKIPTITVVVPTFNSANTLDNLLQSIREQEYDQKKITILLADGGSKDTTSLLAKKYNAKLVHVKPQKKQSAEFNRGYGARIAKGDLLAFFDHDNILPQKKTLRLMVRPFLENKNIVGVETLFYHYDKSYSLLDRYFALYGVNDPLAFYLGKADRQSYIYHSGYHLVGNPKDKGAYYLVSFKNTKIPTLGSNGFLIRRDVLMKHANVKNDNFFHIDVNVDLIRKGYDLYAFVNGSIAHLSNHNDFMAYLWRRQMYMRKYHFQDRSLRRYSLFEKEDIPQLILFIVYSITFIKPIIDAVRGYKNIHDVAWFLHPLMCFGTVIIYGYTFVVSKVKEQT